VKLIFIIYTIYLLSCLQQTNTTELPKATHNSIGMFFGPHHFGSKIVLGRATVCSATVSTKAQQQLRGGINLCTYFNDIWRFFYLLDR